MFGHNWGMGWMGFMPVLWAGLIIAAIYFLVQQGRKTDSGHRIKDSNGKEHAHCAACGARTDTTWKVCPYCGTPID